MLFQILEIVLWSKDPSHQPRRLPIARGKVNVISGASKTGKSAIIPIIDYCLGSNNCTIPVHTIRDHCGWFGVVVETSEGQKLFARRGPGNQKSTSDMFVLEGTTIEVPDYIEEKNFSADKAKRLLDQLAGLTNLDFSSEVPSSGFSNRPSFRDMNAFLFQPQNIVANPNVLFYKADTYVHQEKLRTIFPYVLGAITPELLAKKHNLGELQKELKRKSSELSTIKNVSSKWLAEIRARAVEARELGLVPAPITPNASRDELITILYQVVGTSEQEIRVTHETINEAVNELIQLQSEESEKALELSSAKKRLQEMSLLDQSSKQYHNVLEIQRDRLSLSRWLQRTHTPEHECPICGNAFESATSELNNLQNALEEIEKSAGEFSVVPAAFDREKERVRSDVRTLTEKLHGVQIRISSLERSSEDAKKQQFSSLARSRFIGKLEQALETFESVGEDSSLELEVKELQEKVNILTEELSEADIAGKTKRALGIVSDEAGKILPLLDIEPNLESLPVSLSINDLTVKVVGIEREDYLWEIGSGANWLSYHIAITLGLQRFFLMLDYSPVPSFMAFDQPSQVYFPKKLVRHENDVEDSPILPDEDVDAVKKIFRTLSHVVEKSQGNLQVIVLDHAGEDIWGDIEEINPVEEWRNGKKLVPIEWIQRDSQS